MGNVETAVQYALARVGYQYCSFEGGGQWRLDWDSHHCTDCSGLVWLASNAAGGPVDFPNLSSLQARYCRDHGTLISIADARKTRGALVFTGPNHAYTPEWGHVAISLGDGRIVHAANHRDDICISPFERDRWVNAARIPGLTYGGMPPGPGPAPKPPKPGVPTGADMPGFLSVHVPHEKRSGQFPTSSAILDVEGNRLLGYNGFGIHWSMDPKPQPKHEPAGAAVAWHLPLADNDEPVSMWQEFDTVYIGTLLGNMVGGVIKDSRKK